MDVNVTPLSICTLLLLSKHSVRDEKEHHVNPNEVLNDPTQEIQPEDMLRKTSYTY